MRKNARPLSPSPKQLEALAATLRQQEDKRTELAQLRLYLALGTVVLLVAWFGGWLG